MQTIAYTEAQQHFEQLFASVVEQPEPICIHKSLDKTSVIMISEADYNSLLETLYLLSNPFNANKLLDALARPVESAVNWEQLKPDLSI